MENTLTPETTPFTEFRLSKITEFNKDFTVFHAGDKGFNGNDPQEPVFELTENDPFEIGLFIAKAIDETKEFCKTELLQNIIDGLNEIHKTEPNTIQEFCNLEVVCANGLAFHPTVQVSDDYRVRFIGILNGIVEPLTGGRIAMNLQNGNLLGFIKFEPKPAVQCIYTECPHPEDCKTECLLDGAQR